MVHAAESSEAFADDDTVDSNVPVVGNNVVGGSVPNIVAVGATVGVAVVLGAATPSIVMVVEKVFPASLPIASKATADTLYVPFSRISSNGNGTWLNGPSTKTLFLGPTISGGNGPSVNRTASINSSGWIMGTRCKSMIFTVVTSIT